jgi:hypothetical protein
MSSSVELDIPLKKIFSKVIQEKISKTFSLNRKHYLFLVVVLSIGVLGLD